MRRVHWRLDLERRRRPQMITDCGRLALLKALISASVVASFFCTEYYSVDWLADRYGTSQVSHQTSPVHRGEAKTVTDSSLTTAESVCLTSELSPPNDEYI